MRLEQRKDKVKSAIQELADRLLNMELTAESVVEWQGEQLQK